jgi:hypothetical protein
LKNKGEIVFSAQKLNGSSVENVGFSLAVLAFVGVGALWNWAIAYLTPLVLQYPALISDLELALS